MNKKLKKMLAFLTIFPIVVGMIMLFLPSMVFGVTATGCAPYNVPLTPPDAWIGNPFGCPASATCTGELRVSRPEGEGKNINGTFTSSDSVLTVVITDDSGASGSGFSWTSNIPVCYLVVKLGQYDDVDGNPGNPVARGYILPAGTLCGIWPGAGAGTNGAGISHVSFCYNPSSTTTTTTAGGTTTTTAGGTTTTTGGGTTTTTAGGTTTTTAGGTTTTTLPTTTTTLPTTTTTLPTTTTTTGATTTGGGATTTGATTTGGGATTTGATIAVAALTTGTLEVQALTTTGTLEVQALTTTGTLEVLALTGYDSLWYVIGSIMIAIGIIFGTLYLSTALRKK